MTIQNIEMWWGLPKGEVIPPASAPSQNGEIKGTHLRFYREVFSRDTRIIDEINELDNRLRGSEPIWLHIYSGGGDLLTGFTIANAIQQVKTPIYAVVEGIVASAATLIAVACDKVYSLPNAHFMIHQLSSIAYGTHTAMVDAVEFQNTLMQQIETFYAQKSNLSIEEIRARLRRDTYMSAETAREWGFVDEIITASPLDMVTPVGKKLAPMVLGASPSAVTQVLSELEDDMAEEEIQEEAVEEPAEDLTEQEEQEVVEETAEASVRDRLASILNGQQEEEPAQGINALTDAIKIINEMSERQKRMEELVNQIPHLIQRIADLEGGIIDLATAMPQIMKRDLPVVVRDLLSAESGKSVAERVAERDAKTIVLKTVSKPEGGKLTLAQQMQQQRIIGGRS